MKNKAELESAKAAAEIVEQFADVIRQSSQINVRARKEIIATIASIKSELNTLDRHIDPVKPPGAFFDPSEPRLVGYFVALALISQERLPLGEISPFYGAGVYAIYYCGDAEIYSAIANSETPIYVGKADPAKQSKTAVEQGAKLYGRLNEHKKNIDKVAGIELRDFEYRALAVQSGYQSTAENYLIRLFRPIWNNETRILYGIGKHGDSSETRANNKSPWDTIHPGRLWAEGNAESKNVHEIREHVDGHFEKTKIYRTKEDVFSAFAETIRSTNAISGDTTYL